VRFAGGFLWLYTVGMSHVHPDIVVGEPIPEIEPRVNAAYLEQARLMISRGRVVIGVLLMCVVLVNLLSLGIMVRIALLAVLLIGLAFYAKRSASLEGQQFKSYGVLDRWSIPFRVHVESVLYPALMMILVQLMMQPSSRFQSHVTFFGVITALYGAGGLYFLRQAREPGAISCVHCGYPVTGLTLPCACPECGRGLVDGQSTTDRVRVRSPKLWWGGCVAVLLGVSMVFTSFGQYGLFFWAMPRGVVLKLAASDGGAFNRVMSGTMTEEEELALIEGMVEHRTQGGMVVAYEPGAWLGGQVLAGRLSKAQLDRLYAPITQVKIDAPDSGRVGEGISLRLTAELAILPGVGVGPVYFFEGFGIHDAAESGDFASLELYGGKQQAQYLSFLMPQGNPTRDGVPVYRWTPMVSGTYTVRGRVVFALFAGAGPMMNQRIDWAKEGEAMFGVVPIWWREVELEHTVIVEP